MANLDQITNQMLTKVNGALGCAVVDLPSGMLLSVSHNVEHFPQSIIETAAAAAVDIFRGSNIIVVESLLGNQRGLPLENSIKEILITTAKTFHFMSIVPEKPTALLILITNRNTNLGLGWASVRVSLPKIAAVIP